MAAANIIILNFHTGACWELFSKTAINDLNLNIHLGMNGVLFLKATTTDLNHILVVPAGY